MDLTRERIESILERDDKAVCRALLVLRNNQEGAPLKNGVKHENNKGFRPCHSKIGTSMADAYERNGFLTEEQINYWRQKNAKGNMKIAMYWRQLVDAAMRPINW